MQSLSDIMSNKSFDEPPEAAIIKEFIRESFGNEVAVTVQDKAILIAVPSAALAGALRPHLWSLAKMCDTKKRLVIRIG